MLRLLLLSKQSQTARQFTMLEAQHPHTLTIKTKYKTLLFAIISIPTLYIFTPFIKMFPVGLGLKNLFISALKMNTMIDGGPLIAQKSIKIDKNL